MRHIIIQVDADDIHCDKCRYVYNNRFNYECGIYATNLISEGGKIKRTQQCIDNEAKNKSGKSK